MTRSHWNAKVKRAERVASEARGSDLEEAFAFQLRAMNVEGWVREHVFAAELGRRFRFDFAFCERKIAVEIDGATWSGGRHARGSGIVRDAEKYSLAAMLGWRVIRLVRSDVDSGTGIRLVQETLRRDDAERNRT